jgi:4-carboxymuconolactone decarboxylase
VQDNYLVGIDNLAVASRAQDERRNRAAEIAPDFVRVAIAFAYGDIFGRPGIDARTRVAVAIATVVSARGSTTCLRDLVKAGLNLGWSREEMAETIIQTAPHIGVHRALEALADCHDLLAECESCAQPCTEGTSDTGQE